jgi:uncharacterized protein (DUF952 family)
METIWHITPAGEPALPGDEGFVHGSFTSQLTGSLETHYAGQTEVVLLRLDPEALGSRLVVEPSRGGALFPHIHGKLLPSDVLERVRLSRAEGGAFPTERLQA